MFSLRSRFKIDQLGVLFIFLCVPTFHLANFFYNIVGCQVIIVENDRFYTDTPSKTKTSTK